ncbi:MAG: response regulator receiver protein [Bacteroidetes bacterium]|jgi:CheY-like chemotaxis protein|nr:response regulator receiver protein [Bacteroidota bacterium]
MKKKILLIEDDYLDVESVKRALKKLNLDFEIEVAHNGVDGLSILTESPSGKNKSMPDVIILDINMPKMNGIEFLRIIKSYYSLKSIKIFILTTSAEEYDKLSTESLGVNGYILKPLNFKDEKSKATLALLTELLS